MYSHNKMDCYLVNRFDVGFTLKEASDFIIIII